MKFRNFPNSNQNLSETNLCIAREAEIGCSGQFGEVVGYLDGKLSHGGGLVNHLKSSAA